MFFGTGNKWTINFNWSSKQTDKAQTMPNDIWQMLQMHLQLMGKTRRQRQLCMVFQVFKLFSICCSITLCSVEYCDGILFIMLGYFATFWALMWNGFCVKVKVKFPQAKDRIRRYLSHACRAHNYRSYHKQVLLHSHKWIETLMLP